MMLSQYFGALECEPKIGRMADINRILSPDAVIAMPSQVPQL